MKKIAPPSQWVPFEPSMCKSCFAHCCTMPVPVTAEELFHLGHLKYHEVSGPLIRISQRLKKQGIVQSFNKKTRVFVLSQKANGDCIFLDSHRRCTKYEVRPLVCRDFPYNSARKGFCPYLAK